jgi:GntR family transcriptional regulator of arabinose operon
MQHDFKQGLGYESERILRAIQSSIRDGTYSAGHMLPSERLLCEHYKASRSTVRRAISRLAADGWINVHHGKGMFVQDGQHTRVSRAQTISVMFSLTPEIQAQFQNRALQNGFVISAFPRQDMDWDPAAERVFFEHIRRERHFGLLAFCTPTEPRNDDILAVMAAEGMRIVHVEHYRVEPPDQSFVMPDYRRAGWLAVEHLLAVGYSRVAFFRMEREWPGALLLQQGLLEALTHYCGKAAAEAAITLYPIGVAHLDFETDRARELVRRQGPATGIICPHLAMADETLRFARETGRSTPDDIGIIGIPLMEVGVPAPNVDTIEFDRLSSLLRALERLMVPVWAVAREWTPPRLIARGTTRSS